MRSSGFLAVILLMSSAVAQSDDGRDLHRGGDPTSVTISGVSSGAAMAVQYAVAHSSSIVGVGSIAGPAWGCADGELSRAINDCMCGRHSVTSQISLAHMLASSQEQAIDPLVAGKSQSLKRAYVFQSAEDATVKKQPAQSSIDFLRAIVREKVVVDTGNHNDDSDHAGHGIISPSGSDACRANDQDKTYVRQCGADDNAGKLFHTLYGGNQSYDPSKRVKNIPEDEVWMFDQQKIINTVKDQAAPIARDQYFGIFPIHSPRRENFDMAKIGYLYVPPSCRTTEKKCHVHIALHGCKQDAEKFAKTAGYNNWAERYHVIVVYPAIEPYRPRQEETCKAREFTPADDVSWIEPNDNACWDWWGYLDIGWPEQYRYLTKKAPQMQVIERIIADVTRPIQ